MRQSGEDRGGAVGDGLAGMQAHAPMECLESRSVGSARVACGDVGGRLSPARRGRPHGRAPPRAPRDRPCSPCLQSRPLPPAGSPRLRRRARRRPASSRSTALPAATLDRTVPTGHPHTSAASAYDSPRIWVSTKRCPTIGFEARDEVEQIETRRRATARSSSATSATSSGRRPSRRSASAHRHVARSTTATGARARRRDRAAANAQPAGTCPG